MRGTGVGASSLDDASSYATFELRQSRRSNTLKSQNRR